MCVFCRRDQLLAVDRKQLEDVAARYLTQPGSTAILGTKAGTAGFVAHSDWQVRRGLKLDPVEQQ